MPSPASHDRILIAGAGPVGAVAALLLAQQGIPVTLLEREPGHIMDYRASTFHPPTLDMLTESGIGAALVAMGLKAPVMQYRDRKAGRIAEIDYTCLRDDTDHPYRLQCEQFKLTAWAYEQLAKIPGAELHFAHEITGLDQHDDHVVATVATPAGDKHFSGRYLIGADGGRSAVRKLLGIPFEGYTHPEQFLVAGTHYDFKAKLKDICSVNYTADPDEWFLLLEIPDMWRIVMPVDPTVQAEDAIADTYLQNALQNICPRADRYEILVRSIYRVHQRVADAYRQKRVFLAGDAAHLNNPLGGMGLNGGLHDAVNLTRRLIQVWHGSTDDRTLDGYELQRRPAAIKGVNSITERNKRLMEERDPAVRERNLDAWRKIDGDPALMYRHALDASMISALREFGMGDFRAPRRQSAA